MLALLKLIPLKDWLWALLVVVISVGFASYTVHERHEGAAKIEASDAKAAAAEAAKNKILENVAVETVNVTAQKYAAAISSPIADSPHVIVRLASSASQLPQAAGSACIAPSAADVPAASSVDIGPSLDTVGRGADAEVTALQAIIHTYQAEFDGITP